MENKKRKTSELAKHSECCVCGEWSLGCTNVHFISLREENLMHAFVDIIYFVLEVEIGPESSEICNMCKHKIIEYYHFKKRSQVIQKSSLLQEIMKIVHSYIVRNEIKAITIEESNDKLVITQKTSHQNENTTAEQNEAFDPAAIEIKKEVDELEYSENNAMADKITFKHELEMNFEEDCYQAPAIERTNDEQQNDPVPIEPQINATSSTDVSRLDLILKINQEILRKVNGIDTKFNTHMNLLSFNVPN